MNVIALDLGEKRIGVAVCDPSGSFSLPHGTIERTNVRADIAAIAALAEERSTETIVLGYPLTLDGKQGLAAQKVDAFATSLARVFKGTIERIDERMTTAGVTKTLIAADVSRAKRKRVVDQLAAAAILDTYLARRRGSTGSIR